MAKRGMTFKQAVRFVEQTIEQGDTPVVVEIISPYGETAGDLMYKGQLLIDSPLWKGPAGHIGIEKLGTIDPEEKVMLLYNRKGRMWYSSPLLKNVRFRIESKERSPVTKKKARPEFRPPEQWPETIEMECGCVLERELVEERGRVVGGTYHTETLCEEHDPSYWENYADELGDYEEDEEDDEDDDW